MNGKLRLPVLNRTTSALQLFLLKLEDSIIRPLPEEFSDRF
jgi:hypothetical protein